MQIQSLSLISTLREFDFGLATWRMTIGDFGRDGHMARANWAKTYSFDRAREQPGALARTKLSSDWWMTAQGPSRRSSWKRALAHWCGEENAPLDATGGQTSRLARVE